MERVHVSLDFGKVRVFLFHSIDFRFTVNAL